jgi:PEP-CTERM motif
VQPGNSPGVLNVNGNFTLNPDGTLTLVVAGTTPGTQYSQLNITGTGTFNGTIDLDFVDGFAPTAGETFDFISMGGLTTPTNATFHVDGLAPGFTFDPMFTSTGFSIEATNDGVPTSTPEPATIALTSTGLAALAWRRWRRRISAAG